MKIRVLGKGLIPRELGLAPRMDPFEADKLLIATIIKTNGLTVQYKNPEDNQFHTINHKNIDYVWNRYSKWDPSKAVTPQASKEEPKDLNQNEIKEEEIKEEAPKQEAHEETHQEEPKEKPKTEEEEEITTETKASEESSAEEKKPEEKPEEKPAEKPATETEKPAESTKQVTQNVQNNQNNQNQKNNSGSFKPVSGKK